MDFFSLLEIKFCNKVTLYRSKSSILWIATQDISLSPTGHHKENKRIPMTSVNNQTAAANSGPGCRSTINRDIIDQQRKTPVREINSHFLWKVLCFSAAFSLSAFCFHVFWHSKASFSPFNPTKMLFKVKMNPPSAPELVGRVYSGAVVAFGGSKGRGGRGGKKGRKVSRLSITLLSEHYLCQTPTILGSDTETASRTSGRHGKTQQDTERGVTTSVGTAGADDWALLSAVSGAHTHTHRKAQKRHIKAYKTCHTTTGYYKPALNSSLSSLRL